MSILGRVLSLTFIFNRQQLLAPLELREAREKHKFGVAYTYCKNKLTDYRTEERRKVRNLYKGHHWKRNFVVLYR